MSQALSLTVDAEKFQAQVKRWLADQAPKAHLSASRRLFFELLRRVIMKTPVDTGRARGGWGAGAEAVGVQVPRGAGYSEGRSRSEFKQTKSGSSVRLSAVNMVDYIEALESGTSKQAPFGMVAISLRELEQQLGGRKLPPGIAKVYQQAWAALGLKTGATLRAGNISEALGLTHGSGGLT